MPGANDLLVSGTDVAHPHIMKPKLYTSECVDPYIQSLRP